MVQGVLSGLKEGLGLTKANLSELVMAILIGLRDGFGLTKTNLSEIALALMSSIHETFGLGVESLRRDRYGGCLGSESASELTVICKP